MLKVNHLDYRRFEYSDYIRDHKIIPKPEETAYELGEVVFVKTEKSIGVVLGVIDNYREELRTDVDGMQCFSNIRRATMNDFKIQGIRFSNELFADLSLNLISELCPYCEQELKNIFETQKCPNCNKSIKPCSICEDKTNCNNYKI